MNRIEIFGVNEDDSKRLYKDLLEYSDKEPNKDEGYYFLDFNKMHTTEEFYEFSKHDNYYFVDNHPIDSLEENINNYINLSDHITILLLGGDDTSCDKDFNVCLRKNEGYQDKIDSVYIGDGKDIRAKDVCDYLSIIRRTER